jgi:hypothetical protein
MHKVADEYADLFGFVMWQLGMKYRADHTKR